MSTTAADIVRWRCILTAVLRMACILVGMAALAPGLSWLHEGVMDGDFFDLSYYAPRVMSTFLLLAVGVGGPFLTPMVVRLATPVARLNRCPQCGYAVEQDSCPECGLDVSSLARPAGPILDDVQWRVRTRYVFETISRLLALAFIIYGLALVLWISGWSVVYWAESFADLLETLAYSTWPLMFIVVGGLWFAFAGRVVSWCLPKAETTASQRPAGGNHACGELSDEHPNEHRPTG